MVPSGLPGARHGEHVCIIWVKSMPCPIFEQDLLQVLWSCVTVEDLETQWKDFAFNPLAERQPVYDKTAMLMSLPLLVVVAKGFCSVLGTILCLHWNAVYPALLRWGGGGSISGCHSASANQSNHPPCLKTARQAAPFTWQTWFTGTTVTEPPTDLSCSRCQTVVYSKSNKGLLFTGWWYLPPPSHYRPQPDLMK